jgi:hypothetical protein
MSEHHSSSSSSSSSDGEAGPCENEKCVNRRTRNAAFRLKIKGEKEVLNARILELEG